MAASLAAALGACAHVPTDPGGKPPAAPVAGRALFLNSCAHCHGSDARGDEGPDLHGIKLDDRTVAETIRKGIKGEMPAFAKKFSPEEVAALIAYLRTLQ